MATAVLRGLAANRGYAAAAILSLAIGIGANTAIFSVADALLLRPLPYKDAERLVILWNRSPGLNITEDWFSTAQYFDIRDGHRGFEQVAIAIGGTNNLTGGIGEPERVGTIRTSSNLLPMLGAKPLRGRLLLPAEDVPGHPPAVLLSYGIWMRRYGGDPAITGKAISLNGQPHEVAGVLPRDFSLPREVLPTLGGAEQADLILPLPLSAASRRDRDHEDYNIIGRLKPGVTVEQAQAEMSAITARLKREFPALYPANGNLTFSIVPLREQVAGRARTGLYVLIGAVGFVLLIACANVTNLTLSRAMARTREIAVRAALGATRGRIIAELLGESLLLAIAGGVLGCVLAAIALSWIQAQGANSVPRAEWIGLNLPVLLFTLGVSVVSGGLAGIIPALRASAIDLQSALKDSGRGASGAGALWGGRNHLRRLLVVIELSLAVVLLVGAGLLLRSLARLSAVNPGFNARNVLTFSVTMSGHKYDAPQLVLGSYRDLLGRLEHLPGVTAAGGVTSLPLTQSFAWGPITVEGRSLAPGESFINADERMVAGRYFEAMGIPLLRGRSFNEHDSPESTKVTVVDDRMARELWPGEEALGKRIRLGGSDPKAKLVTVVGVAGSVKQYALDSGSRIALYLPQTQFTVRAMSLVVKCDCDPSRLTRAVKSAVQAIDPDLPVYNVRSMEDRVTESLARHRFFSTLLAIFAALAVALASVGVYGVMAFMVGQGRREIGIRMALGATRAAIVRMVVQSAITLTLTGVALGLAGAAALTRLIRSLLFGVDTIDAPAFAAATAGLVMVALAACYWPARQAAAVDPAESTRRE
jgi:predicted permease